MSASVAWVNGEVVALADATVSVLDEGFRTGLGVFETLRAYDGIVFALDAHVARAQDGFRSLHLEPPAPEVLASAVTACVASARGQAVGDQASDLVVRLTLTPGPLDPQSGFPGKPLGRPTIVVTVQPLVVDPVIYAEGVRAITVGFVRPHAGVKAVSHLTSMLARAEAREAGVDEAILTHDGMVAEGAASNVFAVVDGVLRTPDADILAGVTRARVLALAAELGLACDVGALSVDELLAADEAFVTASTREVVPLVEVDGHRIGAGRPGPVTAQLHAVYREAVRAAVRAAVGADVGADIGTDHPGA